MKRISLSAAALLGLLVAGCGGDNSGSSSGSGDPVASPETFVEAILAPGGTVPADPSAWISQDPQNIQTGQSVVFQLASYSSSGVRTALPALGWESSDTTGTYGKLSADTGLYQAGSNLTSSPQFVGVRYGGKAYYAAYAVKPPQATVIGQVVNSNTGSVVRGVYVEFYNTSGTLVGKVAQPFQGTFRASVPLNAATFQIVGDTIPGSLHRTYRFNGKGYQSGNIDCRAPIGMALSTGNNALGANIELVPTSSEEPDIDGCG